jgi:hypothetical protein
MTIITRSSNKSASKGKGDGKLLKQANKDDAQTVEVKEDSSLFPETTGAAESAQAAQPMTVPVEGVDQPITGRAVFAVRTLGQAVSVETAFLAQDGNVLRLPSVFPNRGYAMDQIDELRALVNRHFDELDGKN